MAAATPMTSCGSLIPTTCTLTINSQYADRTLTSHGILTTARGTLMVLTTAHCKLMVHSR